MGYVPRAGTQSPGTSTSTPANSNASWQNSSTGQAANQEDDAQLGTNQIGQQYNPNVPLQPYTTVDSRDDQIIPAGAVGQPPYPGQVLPPDLEIIGGKIVDRNYYDIYRPAQAAKSTINELDDVVQSLTALKDLL